MMRKKDGKVKEEEVAQKDIEKQKEGVVRK